MPGSSAVQDTIAPVIKSFVVQLPVAAAFRLFTADVGRAQRWFLPRYV
jgi:hypothetical protein